MQQQGIKQPRVNELWSLEADCALQPELLTPHQQESGHHQPTSSAPAREAPGPAGSCAGPGLGIPRAGKGKKMPKMTENR